MYSSSIRDIPVQAALDISNPKTYVARPWWTAHGVSLQLEPTQRVEVIIDGAVYTATVTLNVAVETDLAHDIVLGADWVTRCSVIGTSSVSCVEDAMSSLWTDTPNEVHMGISHHYTDTDIVTVYLSRRPEMRWLAIDHVSSGACAYSRTWAEGCSAIVSSLPPYAIEDMTTAALALSYVTSKHMTLAALRRHLDSQGFDYPRDARRGKLRRMLKRRCRQSARGKRIADDLDFDEAEDPNHLERNQHRANWPRQLKQEFLNKLVEDFPVGLVSTICTRGTNSHTSRTYFRRKL